MTIGSVYSVPTAADGARVLQATSAMDLDSRYAWSGLILGRRIAEQHPMCNRPAGGVLGCLPMRPWIQIVLRESAILGGGLLLSLGLAYGAWVILGPPIG